MVFTPFWDTVLGPPSTYYPVLDIHDAAHAAQRTSLGGLAADERRARLNSRRWQTFYLRRPVPAGPSWLDRVRRRAKAVPPRQPARLFQVRPSYVTAARGRLVHSLAASRRAPAPGATPGSREGVLGLSLAVGSLAFYYTLGYPTSALRSVEQALHVTVPSPQGGLRSTSGAGLAGVGGWPWWTPRHARYLVTQIHTAGLTSLWTGFTASFLSQVAHVAYGHIYSTLEPRPVTAVQNPALVLRGIIYYIGGRLAQFGASLPFYPLWHLTVVWRLRNVLGGPTLHLRTYAWHYFRILRDLITPLSLGLVLRRPWVVLTGLGVSAVYPVYLHRALFDYLQTRVVFPRVHGWILRWWSAARPSLPRTASGMATAVPTLVTTGPPPAPGVAHDPSQPASTLPPPPRPVSRSILRQFYAELAGVLMSNVVSKAVLYPIETVFYACIVNYEMVGLVRGGTFMAAAQLARAESVLDWTSQGLQQNALCLPVEPGLHGLASTVKALYLHQGRGVRNFYPGFWAGLLSEVCVSLVVLQGAYLGYRFFQRLTRTRGAT
ncbi:hypothetical protein IWQ60_003387 [Tieghemiomyces parasiticus]|uniref:Mitochondrial carrier protein n=1 Tax=Tieghemiomyces parasiticus TaxID=78921 RepID=A0A9W8E040_9FUNG|nr:hypothetical protein IWQ60_003387 [Tieghemiomyces parasiticus]